MKTIPFGKPDWMAQNGLSLNTIDALRNEHAPNMSRDQFVRWIQRESGGNPRARSPAGAYGLTQMLPATAVEMGVTDLEDPMQQLKGGLKYWQQGYDREGSSKGAFSYYHGGPDKKIWGPKTRDYANDLGRTERTRPTERTMPGDTPQGELMAGAMPLIEQDRMMREGSGLQTGIHPLDIQQLQDEQMRLYQQQLQQHDPYGSFFRGMAGAKLTPYGGGLQHLGDMLAGGAANTQRAYERMNGLRASMVGKMLDNRIRQQQFDTTTARQQRQDDFSREKFEEEKRQWQAEYDYDASQDAETSSIPGFKDQSQYITAANTMRDDFDKQIAPLKTIKSKFDDISGVYDRRKGFKGWSGSEDIGLVFALMKTYDPGSTVREGEAATAEQVASLPAWLGGLYNQLVSGEGKLSPQAREQHVTNMNEMYKSRREEAYQLRQDYGDRAKRMQIDPRDVMGSGEWKKSIDFSQNMGVTGQQLQDFQKRFEGEVKQGL